MHKAKSTGIPYFIAFCFTALCCVFLRSASYRLQVCGARREVYRGHFPNSAWSLPVCVSILSAPTRFLTRLFIIITNVLGMHDQ